MENPRSTWGKTPEEKIKWREENVTGEDAHEPVSHPTETGVHDDTIFDANAERRNEENLSARQEAEAQRSAEGQVTGSEEPLTVDGQPNTANDSSTTGGFDVSQPAAPDPREDGSHATDEMTVEKTEAESDEV